MEAQVYLQNILLPVRGRVIKIFVGTLHTEVDGCGMYGYLGLKFLYMGNWTTEAARVKSIPPLHVACINRANQSTITMEPVLL